MPPGQELPHPVSASAGFTVSDEDHADGVRAGFSHKEALVRMAAFANSSSSSASTDSAPAAGTGSSGVPVFTAGAENRTPDWDGVWRDTGILFGTQVVAAGIIFSMPESFSSWSNEQKKNSFNNYIENVVSPVIDQDQHYINYALHPYWGATYYIRARERGLDKIPSFFYSAMISAMYELGVESLFENPSIQDLLVTPVAGSLLGAFVFEPWRESIKRKPALRWYDHAALAVTDPVGVLSRGFEKMFGVKTSIMIDYSVPQLQKRSIGSAIASKSSRIGVVVQFPFN